VCVGGHAAAAPRGFSGAARALPRRSSVCCRRQLTSRPQENRPHLILQRHLSEAGAAGRALLATPARRQPPGHAAALRCGATINHAVDDAGTADRSGRALVQCLNMHHRAPLALQLQVPAAGSSLGQLTCRPVDAGLPCKSTAPAAADSTMGRHLFASAGSMVACCRVVQSMRRLLLRSISLENRKTIARVTSHGEMHRNCAITPGRAPRGAQQGQARSRQFA
jgi:hypothetical protein